MSNPAVIAATFHRRAAEVMARLQSIQADTLTFALDVEAEAAKCLREIPPSEARDAFIGSLNALKAALVAAYLAAIRGEK